MLKQEYSFSELENADAFDPEVDYQKARCFLFGVGGVGRDRDKGMQLMQRAANRGNYAAIQFLKVCHNEVTKDNLAQWCVWAENVDPEAMIRVAEYFLSNRIPGTLKDVYRYLMGAAAQGYEDAVCIMANELDTPALNALLEEFVQGFEKLDEAEEMERNSLAYNRHVMEKLADEYITNKEWRSLPKALYWRQMIYGAGGSKTDLKAELTELENRWPELE